MLKVRSSVPGSNNKSCMYYYCSYILSVLTDVPELITVLGSTPTLLCTRFMLIENNTVLSSILYCRSSPQIHVRPPLCRPQGGQGCRSGPFSLSGGEKAQRKWSPERVFSGRQSRLTRQASIGSEGSEGSLLTRSGLFSSRLSPPGFHCGQMLCFQSSGESQTFTVQSRVDLPMITIEFADVSNRTPQSRLE
jgi:hypothetical protein